MKKLALVLSFVFAAAMIAPAFAVDPQKAAAPAQSKAVVAKEATKDGKACSAECAKACGEKKEAAACCAKKAEAAPAAKTK